MARIVTNRRRYRADAGGELLVSQRPSAGLYFAQGPIPLRLIRVPPRRDTRAAGRASRRSRSSSGSAANKTLPSEVCSAGKRVPIVMARVMILAPRRGGRALDQGRRVVHVHTPFVACDRLCHVCAVCAICPAELATLPPLDVLCLRGYTGGKHGIPQRSSLRYSVPRDRRGLRRQYVQSRREVGRTSGPAAGRHSRQRAAAGGMGRIR